MDRKQKRQLRSDFWKFVRQSEDLAILDRVALRMIMPFKPAAWQAVEEFVEETVAAEGRAMGDFTDFLDWLIEHGPEIIALIKMIIELFSGFATVLIPFALVGCLIASSAQAQQLREIDGKFYRTVCWGSHCEPVEVRRAPVANAAAAVARTARNIVEAVTPNRKALVINGERVVDIEPIPITPNTKSVNGVRVQHPPIRTVEEAIAVLAAFGLVVQQDYGPGVYNLNGRRMTARELIDLARWMQR